MDITPAFEAVNGGSNPPGRIPPIAQLAEQLALNEKVSGSIPDGRTWSRVSYSGLLYFLAKEETAVRFCSPAQKLITPYFVFYDRWRRKINT